MKHILSITLLVLCICILPVSAVIQEITVSGSVSSLHREDNTIIITDPVCRDTGLLVNPHEPPLPDGESA